MAKITRKKLARGAKLLVEHIFTPLQSAQTSMTGALGVDQEQIAARMAPFRVNLSIPHLNSFANYTRPLGIPETNSVCHCVPFMLPPLQDDLDFTAVGGHFGNVPTVDSDTAQVILDEVSFSFDTRGEPGAILSNWAGGTSSLGRSADQGKIDYERVVNYDVVLSILERKPSWGMSTPTSFAPSAAVWSGVITPNIELASDYDRPGNPITIADIGKPIDPYKCYVLVIAVPNMDKGQVVELVSIEVSMKFYSRLRPRDSGTSIQNIPARHRGERNRNNTFTTTGIGIYSSTPRPLITGAPSAGDRITANDATGVQRAMAVIDEFFRGKLKGGYNMHSEVPILEELADSAGYSVLAVPLFNNTRYGGISLPPGAGDLPTDFPYVTAKEDAFIDRRYIPIVAPMTIHHVLFTYSWMPFLVPLDLTSASICRDMPQGVAAGEELKLEIGVGMGTGARADMYGYEQIARKTLTDVSSAAWAGEAIDLLSFGTMDNMPYMSGSPNAYNLEIHAMDVEGSGEPGLNGMTSQGPPVFAGRAWAGSASPLAAQRQNMDATAARAKTHGAEQWLEVRAAISDVNADWTSGWNAHQLILGSGGIWVYIIGKTQLV
jgi:hypothetical protein